MLFELSVIDVAYGVTSTLPLFSLNVVYIALMMRYTSTGN